MDLIIFINLSSFVLNQLVVKNIGMKPGKFYLNQLIIRKNYKF